MTTPPENNLSQVTFEDFKITMAELLQIHPDQLQKESSFITDLSVDSLRLLQVVLALEKRGMKVSFEDAWQIQTVGDAYDYYIKHLVQ